MIHLHQPITYINGLTANRASLLLQELGIRTCADLLHFFPYRYIDKTQFYKIGQLHAASADVQIVGKITHIKTVKQQRGSRLVATFIDDTGTMELVWFKGTQWIKDSLKVHTPYVIYGKLTSYRNTFSMAHPEMESVAAYKKKQQFAMQPLYPSTELLQAKGISNKIIRTAIQNLVVQIEGRIQESLSPDVIKAHQLLSKREAMLSIHFPKNQEKLAQAQFRLKFEELFYIQLQLLRKKIIRKSKLKGYVFASVGEQFNVFYANNLPFELTNAQKRVLKEIRKDVASEVHMNRLLQGDVGSGKTIVALLSMLLAIDNGFQAALMAPTEILATQHYKAIVALLAGIDIQVALLTGSVKAKRRRELHQQLEDGSLDILIGTHALLEDKVVFKNLGIAIIDEQHRFGVHQRLTLAAKGRAVDVLVMTATPIPRTLMLTAYGDMDVSRLTEKPAGRKPIQTVLISNDRLDEVVHAVGRAVKSNARVYWVCPIIEESETSDTVSYTHLTLPTIYSV